MTATATLKKPAKTGAALCCLVLAALFAAGRDLQTELAKANDQLRASREENEKLKGDRLAVQQVVADQQKLIQTLRGLGEKRLELLFHVTDIKLGRYTGGLDVDGEGGDDGVRVYLRPVDRDGHALKAAGDVSIRLFDLAAKPEESLLAEYEFPVEEAAKHWQAGFITYHYRFDCRWKSRPPKNPDVTVRASFTDYLTGKTFSAQKLCTVKPPPAQPAK